MSFDFTNTEAWSTSTESYLGNGNHVVTIAEAMPVQKEGKNPQIELRVENQEGSLRDWVVITPNSVGKVVQLFDACGVNRPQEGEFNPSTGALTETCVARLRGKKVGIVVRDGDPSPKDGKVYPRIQGYVDSSRINQQPMAASVSSRADESDIPFHHDEFGFGFDPFHGSENR